MDTPYNLPGTIFWVAPFYNRTGFGVGARAAAISLYKAGAKIRIFPVNDVETGIDDCDFDLIKSFEKTPIIPPITTIIFHVPSLNWLSIKFPEPSLRIIATTFDSSTQGELPEEWISACNEMDQVWVMTEPEAHAFISAGLSPEKIQTFVYWPHPWLDNPFVPSPTLEDTHKTKPFRFLSMAIFQPRRRWDTLIEAYLSEFTSDDGTELYLKVSYPCWHPTPGKPKEDLTNLICTLRKKTGSDATITIDEELGTRSGILNLIDSCHAYASTDTCPTAPISEARVRNRVLVMPEDLGQRLGIHNDWYISINVDKNAKFAITREMLQYQPHHKFMPKLDLKDVRKALRRAYKISPEERKAIALKASSIPGPKETVPPTINALNTGWFHKNEINNNNDQEKTTTDVVWEGSQFVYHSLALVNRELCLQLIDNNYNLSIIPYEKHLFGHEDDTRLLKLALRFNTKSDKTDIHVRHHWPPNLKAPRLGHWVIIQPWEFGPLPKEWVEKFQVEVDECWVPSHYVKQCYVESGVDEARVFVIPNGINPKVFHPQVAPTPLETKKRFKFLFVGGTIHRKGIDILLKIYSETFTSDDDVTLIIKDFGGDAFYQGQTIAEYIKRLQTNKNAPEIIYINQTLPENELVGLYTACDVLVHPYRGEGFGLPILEAMACGRSVIVTNGGAALDFCKPDYSLLVNAKKVIQSYNHVGNRELVDNAWFFEPEPADLAKKMLYAYQNPEKMQGLGQLAHLEAHNHWKWADTGKKIAERIDVLKGKPLRRELHKAEAELDKKLAAQKSSTDLETLKKILEKTPGDIETLKKLTKLYIERGKN